MTLSNARWELRQGFMRWFGDLDHELNIHILFAKILPVYEDLLKNPRYKRRTLQEMLDPILTQEWVNVLTSQGHDLWLVQCLYIALYHIDTSIKIPVSPVITYMDKSLFTSKPVLSK